MADKKVVIAQGQNKVPIDHITKAVGKQPLNIQELTDIVRRLVELHKDQM